MARQYISRIPGDRPLMLSDLQAFKVELMSQVKILFQQRKTTNRVWLKSFQVRKLLGISQGTLQSMRDNGELPFSQMGGTFYYDQEDIDVILTKRKTHKNQIPS